MNNRFSKEEFQASAASVIGQAITTMEENGKSKEAIINALCFIHDYGKRISEVKFLESNETDRETLKGTYLEFFRINPEKLRGGEYATKVPEEMLEAKKIYILEI